MRDLHGTAPHNGLMPCCHWGYCSDCADRLQKWPVCSRLVESKARIYAL